MKFRQPLNIKPTRSWQKQFDLQQIYVTCYMLTDQSVLRDGKLMKRATRLFLPQKRRPKKLIIKSNNLTKTDKLEAEWDTCVSM